MRDAIAVGGKGQAPMLAHRQVGMIEIVIRAGIGDERDRHGLKWITEAGTELGVTRHEAYAVMRKVWPCFLTRVREIDDELD